MYLTPQSNRLFVIFVRFATPQVGYFRPDLMSFLHFCLFLALVSNLYLVAAEASEQKVTPIRTLLEKASDSPDGAPEPSTSCKKFGHGIKEALAACAKEEVADNCQWHRFTRYVNSALRTREYHDSQTCCCACQRVRNCSAVQRMYLTGECIFHCMGSPDEVFDYFSKAWIKIPFVE